MSIDQHNDNLNAGIKIKDKPIFKWGENNNSSVYGGIIPCNESDISISNKIYGLSATNWQEILDTSYIIANHTDNSIFTKTNSNLNSILQNKLNRPTPYVADLISLLNRMKVLRKQFNIDGMKNIWIVKAPDVSRGVGMQLLYRLDDILECERGMSCRTVQKYIENPLLASSKLNTSNTTAPRIYTSQNRPENTSNQNFITVESSNIPTTTHDHNLTSTSNEHQNSCNTYKNPMDLKIDIVKTETIRSSCVAFPYRRKNRKAIKKLSFLKECILKKGIEGNERGGSGDIEGGLGGGLRVCKDKVKFIYLLIH